MLQMYLKISIFAFFLISTIFAENRTCADGSQAEILCKNKTSKFVCPTAYDGQCEVVDGRRFCCPIKDRRFNRVKEESRRGNSAENLKHEKISDGKVLQKVRTAAKMSISKNGTETEKNSKNSTGKARNLKSETSKVMVSNGLKTETKIEATRNSTNATRVDESAIKRGKGLKAKNASEKAQKKSAESPKNQTVVLEAPRNGIPLLERLDEKRYHFSPSLSPSVLEEILVTTDVLLPKISQNTPSEMTISLSKTIIRGTCFDRYIYCGEFRTLCTHPTFEFVMAQKCALTCDRCIEGNIGGEENLTNDTMCIDLSSECQDNVNLCEAPLYRETMHKLCPKSCKICTPFCKDRHDNCLTYKEEGFCENAIYTLKERQYLCGEMCGICGNHTENRAF